jgi:phospholipid-binding lipoprotein MlaA
MTSNSTGKNGGWGRVVLAAALAATLTGCATGPNPRDPYENFNRAVFRFNDAIDENALKPAATAYKRVLPTFVQTGVGNFFGNLSDVWSSANNLMQGKGEAGMSDFMRVAVNSTFGVFGVFDIASEAQMPKHNEDFGQTLGVWGLKQGPYLMLPLLGPSNVRDTLALPVDFSADLWTYTFPVDQRNIGIATRIIDKRAALLDASDLMEEAALDRYEFVRDSYIQLRESKVRDGESRPRTSEDDEPEAPTASSDKPS